jgi:hypothetical protein
MTTATQEKEQAKAPFPGAPLLSLSPEQVQHAINWALRSPKVPNQLKISLLLSMWLQSVESFHNTEDEALAQGKFDSTAHEHRQMLSMLIARGEELVLAAKQNGVDSDAPFTVEDIAATVESLHLAFHAEHRNSNTEAVNKEIAKLFPDEE